MCIRDRIIIGSGTENLYAVLVQLLGREKRVAVENPSYPKITKIYHKNGVSVRAVNVDQYGFSVSELSQENADIVHISPSHQFPLGIIMPVKRRQEILKWAYAEEGRYIIEDDYDSCLLYTSIGARSGNPAKISRQIGRFGSEKL